MPRTGDGVWIPRLALATVMLALMAADCGRGVVLVPVSGRVDVDGKPLTTGRIMVVPDQGRPATANLGPDGRFSLSTFTADDGVVAGRHRVEVVAFEPVGADQRRWLVPRRIGNVATSDVVLEVTAPTTDAVISISTGGEKLEVERVGGD